MNRGDAPPTRPAALQARSRATTERLLAATLALLAESGLEAAVIPRIAERAGVSPANIYRRFVDKDALVRAAILHGLRASAAANEAGLDKALVRATLADSARRLVALLMAQHRRQPQLMRAMARFIDHDSEAGFVQEARALVGQNAAGAVRSLLVHREEITHPDPARALGLAVLNAAAAIEAFALAPEATRWLAGSALTDTEMAREQAAAFVAYLQAPSATPHRRRGAAAPVSARRPDTCPGS